MRQYSTLSAVLRVASIWEFLYKHGTVFSIMLALDMNDLGYHLVAHPN
jgi:hypothetical protein